MERKMDFWTIEIATKFEDDNKNDIDIGMLFYIAKQSDSILFYGSNDKSHLAKINLCAIMLSIKAKTKEYYLVKHISELGIV